MVKLAIAGVAGRMGGEILRAGRENPGATVTGGTVLPSDPAAEIAARLGVPVDSSIEAALARGAQAVIDFTSPAALAAHASACEKAGAALVVGTTGLGDEERAALQRAAEKIPVVFAPNMSMGMNVLFDLVERAARALPADFDVEIVEAHHRHKRDAPSGSALRLAESVDAGRDGSTTASFGRHGQVGERPRGELGIHAVRGGDVAGDHTVFFFGDGERLELTHRASSRDAFAKGAVQAAIWAAGRAPGMYSMRDVLSLGEKP